MVVCEYAMKAFFTLTISLLFSFLDADSDSNTVIIFGSKEVSWKDMSIWDGLVIVLTCAVWPTMMILVGLGIPILIGTLI